MSPETGLRLFQKGQLIPLCSFAANCTPHHTDSWQLTCWWSRVALCKSGPRLAQTVTRYLTQTLRQGAAWLPFRRKLPGLTYCSITMRAEDTAILGSRSRHVLSSPLKCYAPACYFS